VIVTMREILKANGISELEVNNPTLTRKIAAGLRARGFSRVTIRVDGKPQRVWTSKLAFGEVDVNKLLDKVVDETKEVENGTC
jgi:hypothetical protein